MKNDNTKWAGGLNGIAPAIIQTQENDHATKLN
jgi:hypothetical protein